MKATPATFALLFCLLGCRQLQELPDCDCQSTAYSWLTDKTGIYAKGYVTTINAVTGQPDGFYSLSCNPNFIVGKAVDQDTIVLSGRSRRTCFRGETVMALPNLLELTAVRKK